MTTTNWIDVIAKDFILKKQPADIHIDNFIAFYPKEKKEIFDNSISIFNQLIPLLQNLNIPFTYQIDLKIELNSVLNKLHCIPLNVTDLIESIDILSVPEIIIFYPEKKYFFPQIEYYTCPIFYNIEGLSASAKFIYEEYRTIDEVKMNDMFTRWLTMSYFNLIEI